MKSTNKDDYQLVIRTTTQAIKHRPTRLRRVCIELLRQLSHFGAISLACEGEFIQTYNKFKDYWVLKRYIVTIMVPYTKIEIRKISKGSLDKEEVLSTIKYIKEKYYEGI